MGFKTIITLPFLGLRLLFDVLLSALTGVVWRPRHWSYVRNLKYTFLNSMAKYGTFTLIIKVQSISTLDTYRLYMKSQKTQPEVVMFDDGSGGGWIGSSKAKNILLYLHGGTYTNAAAKLHMQMLGDFVTATQDHEKQLGVFVLEYGLAPKTQYPTALIQSVNAPNYILQTTKVDPVNVFVAGDSSGGNLALGLISHLSHPHPKAPNINLKGKKIAGAFLLSPWVTFESSAESIKANSSFDFIEQRILIPQSLGFLGAAMEDQYNVPLSASPEWWENLKVKDLCIIAGDYEIFRDDIVAMAKKLQVYNPNTEYYVESAEVHVQSLVDRGLKLGMAQSEIRFREWMLTRL